MMIQKKLVVGKMKDETAGVGIEESVGLTPKIYSYLVDENSEHKKTKGEIRNIAEIISRKEYKYVLFNKKCLGYSINRVHIKDYKIGTYEISKISLCFFDDKKYIKTMDVNFENYTMIIHQHQIKQKSKEKYYPSII